jgi:hypothetical protein
VVLSEHEVVFKPYDRQRRFAGEIADTAALERWIAALPLPAP